MVLETCQYKEPQMTSSGQDCTPNPIPMFPCDVCKSFISDILYIPLPQGLAKNINDGIMYLRNTTDKVKNLSVDFELSVPIQGYTEGTPGYRQWGITGTVQVLVNSFINGTIINTIIGESLEFSTGCSQDNRPCYSTTLEVPVKTGVKFITMAPNESVRISILVHIRIWGTISPGITLCCPAAGGKFSCIIKFFNYVDA
jgi:hypothetical protein